MVTHENIFSKEIAQSIVKIYWLYGSFLTGTNWADLDWHFPHGHTANRHLPNGAITRSDFPRRILTLLDISRIIMYYYNFPLTYIFVNLQVISRSQKTDFDLHPNSVIYTGWKAGVIDDTESMSIKILRY